MDFETPEADAVEQTQQDAAAEEEASEENMAEAPSDVNPADLAEQHAAVPEDDGYDHE